MGILIRPEYLKRYKDVSLLLLKHGKRDLVVRAGLEEVLGDHRPEDIREAESAAELVEDLEDLGPTYIKLGQMLSTRADLIPKPYLNALSRLQDDVEPFSFDQVERIVTEELGVRLSKAFIEFESEPIAAASLGQVHRAILRDARPVAVKVQRPNVREVIVGDLDALEAIAEFLDENTETGRVYEFRNIIANLRQNLLSELDYEKEASHLRTFRQNLAAFERIVVPEPVPDYTTSRVLTMDYVRGTKITSLSPLARIEIDGEVLANELFRAYLQQLLVDGFFHADPHPGNVFVTDDGRIALIDLGMVGRISPDLQETFMQMLLAIGDGRGADTAAYALKMGEKRENFDEQGFRNKVSELVARNRDARLSEMNVGRIVFDVSHISGICGVRLPQEFTMIGKMLLNLDQVVDALAPNFDPLAAIRDNAPEMMMRRVTKGMSPSNVFSTAIEIKDFTERLPSRINRILDTIAENNLKVEVDAIDEKLLMEGLQKVANRITMGLILAALIVGAAMLMKVETTFTILGYPGVAMLLFLLAAGGGLALAVNILWSDISSKKDKF